MTSQTNNLQGEQLVDVLNSEISETTTNDMIATFVAKYQKFLSQKLVEARTNKTEVNITSNDLVSLLTDAATEVGVENGSAVINELIEDPSIKSILDSFLADPSTSAQQESDSLLKDFDDVVNFEDNVDVSNIDTSEFNTTALDFAQTQLSSLGSIASGTYSEIGNAKRGLVSHQYNKYLNILKDPDVADTFKDIAFEKIVSDTGTLRHLTLLARDSSVDLNYRGAAYRTIMANFKRHGVKDGILNTIGSKVSDTVYDSEIVGSDVLQKIGKKILGDTPPEWLYERSGDSRIVGASTELEFVATPVSALTGIGTGAVSAVSGIYGAATSGLLATEAQGHERAQAILGSVAGGTSFLRGIYSITDTIATQIAKRGGTGTVTKVASFLSTTATKTAGGLTSTSRLTKAASGFGIAVGSALAIGTGVTAITMASLDADAARRSGNHGRAAMYGIQATLDSIGLVLDVVSLVADFLPPIGTVVSAVLDIINLGIAGLSTLFGALADLVDTRSDEEKSEQALDALIASEAFTQQIDSLASDFKEQGYDVFEYIVDAENTGTTEGDADGSEIDRTITRYLTDEAQRLNEDNNARKAIVDASSSGRELDGGNKDDFIDGGQGADTIRGHKGDDILRGGSGQDSIFGGEGDDDLSGGSGADSLFGGPGNDTLRGTPGTDRIIDGGEGDDTFVLENLSSTLFPVLRYSHADRIKVTQQSSSGTSRHSSGFSEIFTLMGSEINLQDEKAYYRFTPDFKALQKHGLLDSYSFNGTGDNKVRGPIVQNADRLLGLDSQHWTEIGSGNAIYDVAQTEKLQVLYTHQIDSRGNIVGLKYQTDIKNSNLRNQRNTKQFFVTDGADIFVAVKQGDELTWFNTGKTVQPILAHYSDTLFDDGFDGRAKIRVSRGGRTYNIQNPDYGSININPTQLLAFIIHNGYVGTTIQDVETIIADTDGTYRENHALNANTVVQGSNKDEAIRIKLDSTVNAAGGNDTIVIQDAKGDITQRLSVDGGAGEDTLRINSGSDVTVTLSDPDSDSTSSSYITGVENIMSDSGNDTLTGNRLANVIAGSEGNDTINAGDGNDVISGGIGLDTIDGGLGSDTLNYSLENNTTLNASGVRVSLEDGETYDNAHHFGEGLLDRFENIENVFGTRFNDRIVGDSADNTLGGGAGNDRIFGHGGSDFLLGGSGDDTLTAGYANETTPITEQKASYFSGGLGSDTIIGDGGGDTVSYSIDKEDAKLAHRIILGEEGVYGSTQSSSTLQTSRTGQAVDPVATRSQFTDNDKLLNIDNVIGGEKDDYIVGNSQSNVLNGADGNDRILAGEGADSVYLSSGNDVLSGGGGQDTLIVDTKKHAHFIDLEEGTARNSASFAERYSIDGYTIGKLKKGDVVTIELTNDDGSTYSEDFTLKGNLAAWAWPTFINRQINESSTLSKFILGTQLNSGYRDYVTLLNNWEGSGVRLLINGEDKSSKLYSISSKALPKESAIASLDSFESVDASQTNRHADIRGTQGDNVIKSGSGSDYLEGKAGDDQLLAGAGDDTVYAGADNDSILGGAGRDNLYGESGTDLILGGEGDDNIFGGTESDVLYGGLGNDVIKGGEGNDYLFADGGSDVLKGGAGDDTYTIFENSKYSHIEDNEGKSNLTFEGIRKQDIEIQFTDSTSPTGHNNQMYFVDRHSGNVLVGITLIRSVEELVHYQNESNVFNLLVKANLSTLGTVSFSDGELSGADLHSFIVEQSLPAIERLSWDQGARTFGINNPAETQGDQSYTFTGGNLQVQDINGTDSLNVENLDHVSFFREGNDLKIFDLDGIGQFDSAKTDHSITLLDYFGEGEIESISLTESNQTLSSDDVSRLVQATSQFLAEHGVSDIGSADISEYRDELINLTTTTLG
ncbi:hypothetical protein D5R81_06620 [Parashewanella spongiae]|uniref:Uncharacterized protein n=1 Tax=Parashewanella spongiae TaxID=342950 RepID=A0A3A6U2E0_9GAMM|nr:calcium-binding protein [Parashewanella spongiae]MCL1077780.1 hypothetical protein [Parashewanella spongiae]RJY18177.1 hypothetical protein D5R81_06620 [Parashewanella spongiae]